MKFNAQNRNILITVALGGTTVAYVFLLFLPTQKSISALQEELAAHQNTIAEGQSLNAQIADLEQRYRDTLTYSQNWKEQAPSPQHRAPALSVMSRCAAEAGVTTLQFDPQPTQPLATVSRIPVFMKCHGTFAQTVHMLQLLEALPATIWVEELRVAAGKEDPENVVCELTLVVFADNQGSSG